MVCWGDWFWFWMNLRVIGLFWLVVLFVKEVLGE